mgnify:CR=1 FL=1
MKHLKLSETTDVDHLKDILMSNTKGNSQEILKALSLLNSQM